MAGMKVNVNNYKLDAEKSIFCLRQEMTRADKENAQRIIRAEDDTVEYLDRKIEMKNRITEEN